MNKDKYIIDANGKRRKRTADDAPFPLITPASIDTAEIWRTAYEKPSVSKDFENLLRRRKHL